MADERSRREFMRDGAALALGAGLAARAVAQESTTATAEGKAMIWGNLLHLGYNMWCDWDNPLNKTPFTNASPVLRFDQNLWDEIIDKMAASGMTMVVIDLGEGVKYDSHPELAVEGSWTPEKLRAELKKIRDKGLEPIPKLNFSATHDTWLGPYHRCVSTDTYYGVCRDVIAEAAALFDQPRFFHLGMDEETAGHQSRHEYAVIRQYDLWWKDFLFLVDEVEKAGCRPWIWSDYIWEHKDVFLKRMPKSVVQSNWYYSTKFDTSVRYVEAFHDLIEAGYDQIPTGSNWSHAENFGLLVDYCRQHIPADKLLGFLQTPWKPTVEDPDCRRRHMEAIDQVAQAKAKMSA